ncbi:acyl-CoA dehydrogenase [Mycobacterium paraffinicum]|uniref:Acyl-CoA dehydrogenase n=1 Tax=Mycobacterium paraffinicum TaxID=53378 RepID=A0A1Q4H993_9MYCO|nr:acyl-CoA dehydrogenase [Mycobacterium paraffinicum]OJZ64120.1 acyl-CoA dehydrogenase [Mycobacterium paraffinicum]
MSELLSRRDIDFLLYEWLDIESLTQRERFAEHSRETFDAVLDLSTDIATRYFATHNKKSDAHEPRILPDGTVALIEDIKTALDAYIASGLIAGEFDEAVGGMQLPTTVARASMAFFQAANAGTANYPFLTIANAHLIAAHGTDEQVNRYVRPMLEGRYFGTMCLSEPHAGSSLADITTRAERQADGTYRITGTKMWISGGDHDLSDNIVHLVLAKTPGGGAGVKSISLFIVPKYLTADSVCPQTTVRNDVVLSGLNHKMGNRGTTNAVLTFGDGTYTPGDQPGAVGYLVGEENRGLAYMFHMMNEARIGVGFLATALGYVGYLKSVEYTRARTQGRPPDLSGRDIAPVPLIEHADVRRMLLAQKSYVEGAMALGLYCARLVDEQASSSDPEQIRDAGLLLDVLTPIAKSWPSQWCLLANDLAIQTHGGYGYTRDYDVEQHYRDNRLNPIHEGTNGIQGIDLLGRKVRLHDGAGVQVLTARIAATVQRAQAGDPDAGRWAAQLHNVWDNVREVTTQLVNHNDRRLALANSSIYLDAVGHTLIAWMWLDQLNATGGRRGSFYAGKRAATRYFFTYELPKVSAQLDLLATMDTTTLDMHPDWF